MESDTGTGSEVIIMACPVKSLFSYVGEALAW